MLDQSIIEAEKKWAQLVVSNAKSILIRNKKVASGKLVNSVRYKVEPNGKIKFLYNKDGKWVTQGRRKGAKFPPPKAISNWIKQKGIKGRGKDGRFISNESLTYLISRGIAKKGIKPLPFMKMATKAAIKQLPKILKPVVSKTARQKVLKDIRLIKP
jgi:hypothetical protein